MFYAERIEDPATSGQDGWIAERGVFMSLDEFVPYRRQGWSGTQETDAAADSLIAAQDAKAPKRCTSHSGVQRSGTEVVVDVLVGHCCEACDGEGHTECELTGAMRACPECLGTGVIDDDDTDHICDEDTATT